MNDRTRLRAAETAASGCHFSIDLSAERWGWNDECFRLLGFEPGDVLPTTGLVRAHTEAEDRHRWRDALDHWGRSADTWASVITMVDARRRRFEALVVGSADRPGGRVDGYLVDMSAPIRAMASAEASRQIKEATASYATIEQAKGILAAMTGRSVADSFLLLRQTSMDRNIPLRVLAAGVVEAAARGELAELGLDSPLLGGHGRTVEAVATPSVRARLERRTATTEPPMGPGARRRDRSYDLLNA